MSSVPEISPAALVAQLQGPAESRPWLLDVRFEEERQTVALADTLWVPLPELPDRLEEISRAVGNRPGVVYCHHGVRSRSAAQLLRQVGVEASSLAGGIDRYALEVDPGLPRY